MIAVLITLFLLFIFPLLSDIYQETSLFVTIIALSVVTFYFEKLIDLFRNRQNEKELRLHLLRNSMVYKKRCC